VHFIDAEPSVRCRQYPATEDGCKRDGQKSYSFFDAFNFRSRRRAQQIGLGCGDHDFRH